jgi:hypothetical protein
MYRQKRQGTILLRTRWSLIENEMFCFCLSYLQTIFQTFLIICDSGSFALLQRATFPIHSSDSHFLLTRDLCIFQHRSLNITLWYIAHR